jgi:hypothetical protein
LGTAKESTFEDVLAWAVGAGDPGDVICTSRGLFFVQERGAA